MRIAVNPVLVADIGGSHITSAIADADQQTTLIGTRQTATFNGKASADDILSAWLNCLQATLLIYGAEVHQMAIAMPGPFDYHSGVCYIRGLNKLEALYTMDIRSWLAHALKIPAQNIKFRNDAESCIAGEVAIGAVSSYNIVLGITLGTGFGSAIVNNGVATDVNLGSEKYRDSIADDYFSTRWFLQTYHRATGINLLGVKELAELVSTHLVPKQIFHEFALNLSDFLQNPVKVCQPEALVVCGNISRAHAHFLPVLRKRLPVPVYVTTLYDDAALHGAAALHRSHVQVDSPKFIAKKNPDHVG